MSLDHWMIFWTIVLVLGMVLFALLAIVVSIGGFFDIRRLFQQLRARQSEDS